MHQLNLCVEIAGEDQKGVRIRLPSGVILGTNHCAEEQPNFQSLQSPLNLPVKPPGGDRQRFDSMPSARELHHCLNRFDLVDHLQKVLLLSHCGRVHVADLQTVLISEQT